MDLLISKVQSRTEAPKPSKLGEFFFSEKKEKVE